ncbi:MAG: response regulator [Saprospiraceae bacterium]
MKKILIIEDNTEMRENITEILQLSGYHVFAAADGVLGVQAAREHKPDLILCDIMMPNLDGFGVLKILNHDELLKNTPLVFLTAKAEKEDFRKGMNLGAEDYLIKPFEDSDLLQVVENKLHKYENLSKSRASKILTGLIHFEEFINLKQVQDLITHCETKEFGKKSKIWMLHENINNIYYIEKGMAKEVIETVGGKELILDFYRAPCFMGLYHLFQTKYKSTTEIIEPSYIKSISKKLIEDIILKENLLTSYQHLFAERSQDYVQRLAINSFGNVREKVAYHLYNLSKSFQESAIHLGREDLASYCGIAKETLIRTLTEFKEEKLIQLNSEGIIILQSQKLISFFL